MADGPQVDAAAPDAAPAPTCPAALAISGLVAYLPLDDRSGNIAKDKAAIPHDAELSGTTWTTGRIGGALAFDAKTDFGTLASGPQLDDLRSMSVCAWIRPGIAVAPYGRPYMTLVDKTDMGGPGWSFYLNLSTVAPLGWHVMFYSNYNDIQGGGLVPVSTWTHVCATWDGSPVITGISLYVNGVKTPAFAGSDTSSTLNTDVGTQVRLGATNNLANPDAIRGAIDEVLIYDHALTGQQILSIYQCAH